MPAPIPTPTIPTGALFSASSSATIHAPASKIYNTLLESTTWPSWSSFVPHVSISSQPPGTDPSSTRLVVGTAMNFTVHMSPKMKTKSPEEVNIVSAAPRDEDPPGTKYTICWVGRMMPGVVLRAERVNEIVKTEDPGRCEYKTWETFAGVAAYAVKWSTEGLLVERFEDWTRDLKAYCEKGEGEGEGPVVVEGK
ncbi:hypothetical protein B9Z65_5650 [Elsinoe australis]|uniref:Uncharacterized protein n=1 Tax=Elsinoe australis TaxID=40998 RepID=A0A2P7Z3D3_9PEZI|nr:hypothetical protein B9Z65_5650 [Elsinoe australis]